MRFIEMELSNRVVLRTDFYFILCYWFFFYLFCFFVFFFTNRLILLALHFNLSLVTLLRLACSAPMPCQLPLLVLTTCCVCKL